MFSLKQRSPTCLIVLYVLFAVSLGQPPIPNGKDSAFLVPVEPARLRKTVPVDPRVTKIPPPSPSEALSPSPELPELEKVQLPRYNSPKNLRNRLEERVRGASRQKREADGLVNRMAGPANCQKLQCRNLDGKCTGTKDEFWGAARFPQFSYLKDHTSLFVGGFGLKSAREISDNLSAQSGNTKNSHGLNELFVFFGQFLDHNLVATPARDASWPIENPGSQSDPLPFVRSTRALTGEGSNERPVNTLSSAVDLVAVYGNSDVRNEELLEFDDSGQPTGKLRTSSGNLLPFNAEKPSDAVYNAPSAADGFFIAGDHRVNEHPVLTAFHTIFLREHNRLCAEIKSKLPLLSGKDLYEYARKLNIAQFQKIVYEEFYPAIIKEKLLKYKKFQMHVNPTVSDVFAGAAFRVGHTMVGNAMTFKTAGGAVSQTALSNVFFRAAATFSSTVLDDVIRGAAGTRAQEVDLKVVDGLRNMLFDGIPMLGDAFDLIALNIQRGRDHNLPHFNEIRTKICGLKAVTSFSQISSDPQTAQDLITAYNNNVDDVEAWPGLVAEDHLPKSGLGSTMACLWRLEFTRLRDGDQFFYLRKKKIPKILKKKCKKTVKALFKKKVKLLKEIIIRNTGVTGGQLPLRIFKD